MKLKGIICSRCVFFLANTVSTIIQYKFICRQSKLNYAINCTWYRCFLFTFCNYIYTAFICHRYNKIKLPKQFFSMKFYSVQSA